MSVLPHCARAVLMKISLKEVSKNVYLEKFTIVGMSPYLSVP